MMKGSRNGKGVEEWSKAGSFVRKPDKGWLHSAQAIKDGGVCYALKYLGCIEVLKSMRTLQYDVRQQVTKEAMYRCCEANGYKFSKRKKAKSSILKLLADHPRTVHSGTFISLTVSVSGIVLTAMSSGEMISKHDMQGISFASGGEKDCPDIVGYVAKDAKNRRACHVLDCPQSLSYDVINTIGQAFELRYKMFLDDPPQLLPVPRRFEGSIGGEQQQAAAEESRDRTYERPRFEPEDEFADGYFDEFDDEHAYDSPAEEPKPAPMDEDSEHYQKPRSPACEMSNYDTPHSTLESHSGRDMASSLEFTVGTQFESAVTGPPLNTPSYNNPLASVPTVGNLPTLYDTPGATVNGTGQESNGGSFRVNWETFDEEITSSNRAQATAAPALGPKKSSPEPALPERADSPQHNSLGYALPTYKKKPEDQTARRTPPPLPKPYARKPAVEPPRPPAASEDDLSRKDWFHGPMSRHDAESLLVRDGDFLVRESTTNPGQYVLTGSQNGYPKHLLLVDPEGVVRTKDHSFESVDHLVRYHRDNKVPIISSGSVMILRQSVVRNDPSQSAYDVPI
ncbi:SHC-transforming 1-like [Paramuricea clavata]|uniref:SHC-transforming 1-like n=1 Tax=Paramuricea clavata TaxID=317549 RepID=A0A6S7FRI9_PARCT|nr:SHC-transforming 1-like [Paramuricea clavata]